MTTEQTPQDSNEAAIGAVASTAGLGSEPTYDELNRLWTAAIECEGIGGASAQARQELIAARQKKFTWIGGRECNLRIAIDRYIEHRNRAITFGVPNV